MQRPGREPPGDDLVSDTRTNRGAGYHFALELQAGSSIPIPWHHACKYGKERIEVRVEGGARVVLNLP